MCRFHVLLLFRDNISDHRYALTENVRKGQDTKKRMNAIDKGKKPLFQTSNHVGIKPPLTAPSRKMK